MDNCMTGWWLGTSCNLCVENETDICKTCMDWNIYSTAFSDVWNIIWTIQLGLVLGNPVLVIMDNLIFTGENRVVWRMYLLTLDKGLMLPHIRTFMMNKICKLMLCGSHDYFWIDTAPGQIISIIMYPILGMFWQWSGFTLLESFLIEGFIYLKCFKH